MKTATVIVTYDQFGNNVQKVGVTPAEAQVLAHSFVRRAKGTPVVVVEETEKVERSANAELARLRVTYKTKLVESLFGKANPRFPKDFAEALAGIGQEQTEVDQEVLTGRKQPEE